MEQFELNAEIRQGSGKADSRRMRHAGMVPGIVYGDGKDPVALKLQHLVLMHQIENEAFYSQILTLNVDGKSEQVVLRDMQRHPSDPRLLHIDFQRVSATQKLHMQIPLHFINAEECDGVKTGGGAISHLMTEVEITCLPKDLPEFLEVDLLELELDQTLHMSDIKLPEGVEIPALAHGPEADQAMVSVHKIHVEVEPVEGEEGEEGEAAGDEASEDDAESSEGSE